VRQDDVSINAEMIARMPVPVRQAVIALRRSNRVGYDLHMREYRRLHAEERRQIIRAHDAGGPSPGILRFIQEVIVNPLPWVGQLRGFPRNNRIDKHPGRHNADVHLEGRALDFYVDYDDLAARVYGDWLFDFCYRNCVQYRIQGVIFGRRQWFSEMNNGEIRVFTRGDHDNHVHIELNCDGANLH
jgi:hypothetical protein